MHGNFGQMRDKIVEFSGSLSGNCMYRDWPSERKAKCWKKWCMNDKWQKASDVTKH